MNPTGPATPPWLNNLNQWFENAVKSVIDTLGNAGQGLLQKAPPTISGPARNTAVNASRSFWDLIGKGIQQPAPTVAPKVNPMLVPSTWRPPAPPRPPRKTTISSTRKTPTPTNVARKTPLPKPTFRPPVRPPGSRGGY